MQTLYLNGKILTMDPKQPRAEAVLVENGIISAVGRGKELNQELQRGAEKIDLKGKTMLPAFIDAHSHLAAVANGLLQVCLENCSTFEEIEIQIKDFINKKGLQPGEWVIAKGYDHNMLKEKRHPGLEEVDRWAPKNPLVIQHQSGHVGVFNSVALDLLHITENTQAPQGGKIELKDGRLTGYMEENAFVQYLKKVPMSDMDTFIQAFITAQQQYASFGITTVQEGMLADSLIPIYQQLISKNILFLDVVAYAGTDDYPIAKKAFCKSIRQYDSHFKLGGYKIFLDGSPQGRTAWLRKPYLGETSDYTGYSTMKDADVVYAIEESLKEKTQILAHCNGDAACEQYIRAIADVYQKEPQIAKRRPVMIHAQLLGIDQLAEVKKYGIIPSFFIAHVYHFGETHVKNFGWERASNISPAFSALQQGIHFTFHQDSPVIRPNMLETVWCAVNRTTKEGNKLGQQQCIGVEEALRAVTIHAAYQYGEEQIKGSITPKKRADFVLLDENPLEVPQEEIQKIGVLQTIMQGKVIYRY